MKLLYNIFLLVYYYGIRIASLWNKKAKRWVVGRKDFFQKLTTEFHPESEKKIWMHCASLGEFEQGRPVLKKIQENFPGASIIITFFSPSGYDIVKQNKDFNNVFYLPMDGPIHARQFLNYLMPDVILWVKYEYWFYYLKEIKRRKIPLLMISGVYEKNQVFFKWYGELYRTMLQSFSHFFVQNLSSKNLLQQLVDKDKITYTGDTRCDRVINIEANFIEVKGIPEFCRGSKVIVAGSTWEDDEAIWNHYVKTHSEIQFIIAPHEVDDENLADVKNEFPGSIFYSEWIKKIEKGIEEPGTNCLIIDNIGMLSRLYKYATLTYVGGGFGYNGLHNILEAAVYGKPVIFGPEFDKNFEAVELIECTGAISIESALDLEKVLNRLLKNEEEIKLRGESAKKYIYNNAGASQKIVAFIQEKRLLTN